jgi:4-alpha-glucanotransferase
MSGTANKLLGAVARLYNVQSVYIDAFGHLIEPPAEAILSVLQLLGAPVERMEDLPDALRQRWQSLWQRGVDPVTIAWNEGPTTLTVRLPIQHAGAAPSYQIRLENGTVLNGRCQNQVGIRMTEHRIEGARYMKRRLLLPEKLPLGYHKLELEISDFKLESHLFAAPRHAFTADSTAKRWGLFCPLYALASPTSWGAGNFSDLETFIEFAGQMGANTVGTLPLLPAFLNDLFEPSPYSPVSRLFWNEFYLDVAEIPELQRYPGARAIVNSSDFQAEVKKLRASPLVDYRQLMALKRRALEELARSILNESSERRTSFQRFIESHPTIEDYAAFRSKVEREGKPWSSWPASSRNGMLRAGEYDENVKHYHLYAQWQAHEQMQSLSEKAQAGGVTLYLDFPLGVNRDGYDVWRERAVFATEASGGAPPDDFFTKGQNWGFPPLHPESIQKEGFRYYIRCLRHHLKHAGMLRIDHVMGLHRLYWIPRGFAASDGVYVRYPAEQFYAILGLESHRHQAHIVGENLGTVPASVNAGLAEHKIHGMYVGQFSVAPGSTNGLKNIEQEIAASLNTHDTPTFAGFWNGSDIQDSLELGLISASQVEEAQRHRGRQRDTLMVYLKSLGWLGEEAPESAAVLKAWLSRIADSNAWLLLVNLEDLWLEPLPQNVPGTWQERPNWQRKARFSLEQIRKLDFVVETLKSIDEIRKRGE